VFTPFHKPPYPYLYGRSVDETTTQVVNGQRLKHYIAGDSYNEYVDVIQTVSPEQFIQDNMQEPAEFVFE
jgi:hypothetical protein